MKENNKTQQIYVQQSPYSTPLIRMVLLEKINPKQNRYITLFGNEYRYEFFVNGVKIIVEEKNVHLKKGQIYRNYDYIGTLQNIGVKANPEEASTDSEYIWRISRLIFETKSYVNYLTNKTVYNM